MTEITMAVIAARLRSSRNLKFLKNVLQLYEWKNDWLASEVLLSKPKSKQLGFY